MSSKWNLEHFLKISYIAGESIILENTQPSRIKPNFLLEWENLTPITGTSKHVAYIFNMFNVVSSYIALC